MTDMANEEKPTTDNTLKGILSKKFGNELTEDELVEMGNSLLELCELLLDNCIE